VKLSRAAIGVAGRIGAGKTALARRLAKEAGLQYVRYSQVLEEWLAGDASPRKELQSIGWQVMSSERQLELNARLISRIDKRRGVVVDGLRHPTDFACLSSALGPEFRLIFLDCPAKTRWQRLAQSGRFRNFEEFLAADAHPVEQNIEFLRAFACGTIPCQEPIDKTVALAINSLGQANGAIRS